MARTRKTRDPELLEALRRQSGWYLAAWRDFRGLTLEELVADVGGSKGAVSDLETGKLRADGSVSRFNRTHLEAYAKALGTSAGFLIDVNPYTADPAWIAMQDEMRGLSAEQQAAALRVVKAMGGRD